MLRKVVMTAATALEAPLRKGDRILRLLAEEIGSQAAVPLWQRLRALSHGYLSQSVLMYPMNADNRHLFVSDYQCTVRTPDINGPYRILVKDKLLFSTLTQLFPALHIPTHGVVHEGRLLYARIGPRKDLVDYLSELLAERGPLILKPVVGGGGAGVVILERHDESYSVNARPVTSTELRTWLGGLRNNLISDYVVQTPELAALYPRTTNTIRLLTMWDSDEPFAASAVLRIGNAASYPVDNGLMGGIAAGINIQTGRVGKAVSFPRKTKQVNWYGAHPDTGQQIDGMTIPRWHQMLADMMEVCRHVPYLRYIGWDIVVTADGFKLIEGNHYPGLCPSQAHGPLLADPRVLRFYRSFGVV
jgi:Sugar-transfer associated ATP-grasp